MSKMERGGRARRRADRAKDSSEQQQASENGMTAQLSLMASSRRATRIKNLPLRLGRCLGDDLLPSPAVDDGLREALVVPFLRLLPPLFPLIVGSL